MPNQASKIRQPCVVCKQASDADYEHLSIILPCFVLAAVASGGVRRIAGFTNAIASAPRASMARQKPGMGWRAPCGASALT